jgi:hypothetical protein
MARYRDETGILGLAWRDDRQGWVAVSHRNCPNSALAKTPYSRLNAEFEGLRMVNAGKALVAVRLESSTRN